MKCELESFGIYEEIKKKLKTDVRVCAYYQNDMKKIHHASKGRNFFSFTVTCCYFK